MTRLLFELFVLCGIACGQLGVLTPRTGIHSLGSPLHLIDSDAFLDADTFWSDYDGPGIYPGGGLIGIDPLHVGHHHPQSGNANMQVGLVNTNSQASVGNINIQSVNQNMQTVNQNTQSGTNTGNQAVQISNAQIESILTKLIADVSLAKLSRSDSTNLDTQSNSGNRNNQIDFNRNTFVDMKNIKSERTNLAQLNAILDKLDKLNVQETQRKHVAVSSAISRQVSSPSIGERYESNSLQHSFRNGNLPIASMRNSVTDSHVVDPLRSSKITLPRRRISGTRSLRPITRSRSRSLRNHHLRGFRRADLNNMRHSIRRS